MLALNDWKNNNPNPYIDMVGKKINMLTVMYKAPSQKGRTMWHCKCDCGNEKDIWYAHLKKGQYSCGCMKNKRISEKIKTHGLSDTRLFDVWRHMKQRCYKPYHKSFKDYGARGIEVCEEWRNDFKSFYDWAVANGYDENAEFMKCTIDRIDVNGNYEPNNCRWITMKEQCNNRRNNHFLEFNGEKHTISEWAELLEMDSKTLYKRVELGWSDGQVLGFEPRKGVRVKTRYENYTEYQKLLIAN